MSDVLAALVPVFLTIALGAVLKRVLLPQDAHWSSLEQLTYYVLFPALLVLNIVRADLGGVAVLRVSLTLVGSIGLIAFGLLAARRPICRLLRLTGPGFTSLVQGALRWNTYVGLAVAGALAGSAGLAVAAVAIVTIVPGMNVLSVAVLARHAAGGEVRVAHILAQIARNPLIWSCAVGGAISALGLPVPPVLISFTEILARASLALGLLVVGAGLRLDGLRRPSRATWAATVLKLVVLPCLAVGIGRALGLAGVDLLVVTVAAAVPSAPNGYVLARQMGGDAPLLAEMLTVQTLLAAVTLSLAITAVGML